MANATLFSLRIFVADGDPDGLRLVERSNWIGKAVMFPRALYPQVRGRASVRGRRGTGRIYIGKGNPVRPRLENHYAHKDFWTRTVSFPPGRGS